MNITTEQLAEETARANARPGYLKPIEKSELARLHDVLTALFDLNKPLDAHRALDPGWPTEQPHDEEFYSRSRAWSDEYQTLIRSVAPKAIEARKSLTDFRTSIEFIQNALDVWKAAVAAFDAHETKCWLNRHGWSASEQQWMIAESYRLSASKDAALTNLQTLAGITQ